MGGGMNGDEVREWIVHQVTRFGKRTLSEVMEGLKKTSPFSVQDNMKSFGFGEFKLKNLQKGVSYRKSTHQLINHFHCPKADLPARIKYLQACDQRMAVPVMLNTGEYLMDDECARVTSFVQLSQGRFRGRNKFKGKSNAHKGKATTKPFHPRDMKSKADSGAPSKRAKMPEINVDVGCERPSKEASDPSEPIMWSARTRSLYVRYWRLLGGTAVLSAETSSSDNPTGPAVEVEHGFESFNEMLIYTSAKTRGLI